jgi:hypothetical protein
VAIYNTMIVGLDESASRSKGDSAVFVLDQDTSECLHYESVTGYPPKSIAKIPRGILEDHVNIEIRNDFIDCSIDVCALEASLPVVLVFHISFNASPGTVPFPGQL